MWAASAYRKLWRNGIEHAIRSESTSAKSTIDSAEIHHFKQFKDQWWNKRGNLRALHALNKVRVPLIRDGILCTQGESRSKTQLLEGIKILDVGCGGGILTEPLARLKGTVIGIDANPEIIEVAKQHAQKQNLKIQYHCKSIEIFAEDYKGHFNAVVASEILEHVTNKEEFLKACLNCLKPGGSIFITTLNKTCAANIFGILMAENVLGLLPGGTHQYEKFISPLDLQGMLRDLNCKTVLTQGLFYSFWRNEWRWWENASVNYALHGVKSKFEIFSD